MAAPQLPSLPQGRPSKEVGGRSYTPTPASGLAPLQLSAPGFISLGPPDPTACEEGGASFQVRDLGLLAYIAHSQGHTNVSEPALLLVAWLGAVDPWRVGIWQPWGHRQVRPAALGAPSWLHLPLN